MRAAVFYMDAKEYLSIRKAYNLVRQGEDKAERLSFSEFSILCRLANCEGGMRTSDIADYQHVLRPTMTHRTKHLAALGLIIRDQGSADKRNIFCSISERGLEVADSLCEKTRSSIKPTEPLSRTTAMRVRAYVDAMGSISCDASELILLGIKSLGGGAHTISELVGSLGLLQPTVSMSVSALEEEGYVERLGKSRHGFRVGLTEQGREIADDIESEINALVVRRRRRGSQE